MARLIGLKALLTLVALIGLAQNAVAEGTNATPASSTSPAPTITSTAVVGKPSAAASPPHTSSPAITTVSPPRTPARQQNTTHLSANQTAITTVSPPRTPARQQNTTHLSASQTAITTVSPPHTPARQQNTTHLSANQTDPSPTISSISSKTDSNDTQTPMQPASTQITPVSTTVTGIPAIKECEGPAARQFEITPITFGVRINIIPINNPTDDTGKTSNVANVTNSTTSSPSTVSPVIPMVMMMMMKSTDQYEVTFKNGSEYGNTIFTGNSFDLKQLKPCTDYSFTVSAITNGSASCKLRGLLNVTTETIRKNDLTPTWNASVKEMCFESEWNISREDRCFNTTVTCDVESFAFRTCKVSIKQHVPPVEKIEMDYQPRYPINITWLNKPDECKNENLTINCNGIHGNLFSSEQLKPFEQRHCTGSYTKSDFNVTGNKEVIVKCDVQVATTSSITNTSITIKPSSSSSNCQGVNFTFETNCGQEKCEDPSSNSCIINKLKPFTVYTCTVTPKYEKHIITEDKKKEEIKTLAGYPKKPEFSVHEGPANNALHAKCTKKTEWNGDPGSYQATANPGNIVQGPIDRCDFRFEGLSYSTDYTISIIAINEQGNMSETAIQSMSTRYNDKAVIGILAFLIIVTTIALLFVLYKIYILQRRKDNGNSDEVIPLSANPLMTVEPIAADNLLDVYKKKIADEGRLFLAEFQSIPRIFSNYTVKEAKNAENQAKNRYVDILPYDYNRVRLSNAGGEAGVDYINASFIEGFKEQKKYIAAQGPKEETIVDFWRMVWEQKSSIIVMVTRCEEGNRNKCAQYWPSMVRETELYGDFVVNIKKEDTCPDYIIRHLTIINRKDKSPEREVTHIQFISWPDHGVPSEPHLLLKLRHRVNSFSNFFSGPIVVHCSAGVGRTGTYIGIDAMMESLEAEGVVDIYGYVVKMRRQRCLMVQVEAQYILIHQALIEFNQFGDTEVPLTELHSSITTLQQDCDNISLMEEEFQRLPKYRNWRTFNTAISEENKQKNRYSSFVPYDFNRVLVKIEEENSRESDQDDDDDDYSSSDDDDEEESTQYINASYIDGYWCPKSLIAAQGPLESTIPAFWQMVYQKKVKNIVMLSKCMEGNQELCAEYWGQEKKTYKDISVEETESVASTAYIKRTIQLQHAKRKEARQVQQYHFQSWPEQGLPKNPQELVEMIKSIKQSMGSSRVDRSIPVVVHCQNGTTRSGIFCALWNLLDSANTEGLLDTFQVCKSLRKERQGMICDFEHYQFLYQAVGGAFPAQNGEVKQTSPSTADTVQIVNEFPAGTTTVDQQVEETAPEPVQAAQAESKDNAEKKDADTESSSLLSAGEAAAQPSTANGPTITVEV